MGYAWPPVLNGQLCSLHNFERGCNHPLGEFSFFRARPAAARPVAWRYTNAAYQDEHE